MSKMTDSEYQNIVTEMVDDARTFMDDEISSSRENALNYLRGETDVARPEEGFSSITSTVSRDELYSYMTTLMEMFAGVDDTVEFIPGEQDEELARQQTDVASHIFRTKNDGWRIMHDTFRSAIGSGKVAGMKVTWDDSRTVWQETYTDLSDQEFEEFENDPTAEIITHDVVDETEQIPVQNPDGSEVRVEIKRRTHDAKVKFKQPANRIRVESIPGEELGINRRAIDSEAYQR